MTHIYWHPTKENLDCFHSQSKTAWTTHGITDTKIVIRRIISIQCSSEYRHKSQCILPNGHPSRHRSKTHHTCKKKNMFLCYLQEPITHKILTYRYNISQIRHATHQAIDPTTNVHGFWRYPIRSRGTTTQNIAHPVTTTHTAHHQAFYPVWPWSNTVHIVIDIYTGFILSQPMTNTSGCCYSL